VREQRVPEVLHQLQCPCLQVKKVQRIIVLHAVL
jgi:hypothetical protein